MKMQKILIIDDSEMNREILIDILGYRYKLEEAEDVPSAMKILRERAEEFSVILLDIVMPGGSGFDVLAYLNRSHLLDRMAVIMISADNSVDNIKKAYRLGAFDYISRPFDTDVVRNRVANTMLLYKKQHQLEEMVAEQIEKHQKDNELMISILSHIVEFRNGESGKHVENIGWITKLLLNEYASTLHGCKLTKEDIELITTASALHDIGKIAISDEILNKPGRLTNEEFEIIKTHSLHGAEMLQSLPEEQQNSKLVKTAYQICRWHHERYDGKGYPDGLKGDEIPVPAQVVAIADVYDALTSERCYKSAYSHETAVQMIVDGQCGSFNPLLLKCFQSLSNQLKTFLSDKEV